jgi:hypothetical protein
MSATWPDRERDVDDLMAPRQGRMMPDRFQAGFCPSCGTYDPVFEVYRVSDDQCADFHHEPQW